ncbi:MAG: hypothetical protein GY832_16905 [Chloroflexi bacterium]|nr:hypothetical protein [Chloroflexota bacterium]
MVIVDLWVVILAPAPSLTTAEAEARSLSSPRFLPVRKPGDEPRARGDGMRRGELGGGGTLPLLAIGIVVGVSTDCLKNHQPDLPHCLRRRRASARSLAVSPWSAQVVYWFVSLGQGAMECGEESVRGVVCDHKRGCGCC